MYPWSERGDSCPHPRPLFRKWARGDSNPHPLPLSHPAGYTGGRGRRAFTLVELLVVIAIIGSLIGVLIPAVQSAREAGRRVSCQSNLRQIALAVTQFHDAEGHFPQGQCDGVFGFGPDGKTWSWMVRILPYVEEKGIYQNGAVLSQTLRQSAAAQSQVRLFLCPSDGFSWRGSRSDAGNLEGFAVGQTNYKAVSGANWGADASQALGPSAPCADPAGRRGRGLHRHPLAQRRNQRLGRRLRERRRPDVAERLPAAGPAVAT